MIGRPHVHAKNIKVVARDLKKTAQSFIWEFLICIEKNKGSYCISSDLNREGRNISRKALVSEVQKLCAKIYTFSALDEKAITKISIPGSTNNQKENPEARLHTILKMITAT